MIRVCPHHDVVCRNGMDCPYTCATGEYDGVKRLAKPDRDPDPTLLAQLIETGRAEVER